mmetsp:Transcript_26951/g.81598  ORF Transcript_26951/g.81598 Transcript_26951/m.81598 type:complete len:195 (-) Transcript_26951:883-1467(-)|eukprot:scaffold62716_cov36-Tisochrysis_lutea.AAC.1
MSCGRLLLRLLTLGAQLWAARAGMCRCSCCSFERVGEECEPQYMGGDDLAHCSKSCTIGFCAQSFPRSCPSGPTSGGEAGLGGHMSATCDRFEHGLESIDVSPAELRAIVPVIALVLLCMCSWCCLCCCCSSQAEPNFVESYPLAFSTPYATFPLSCQARTHPIGGSTYGRYIGSKRRIADGSIWPTPLSNGEP